MILLPDERVEREAMCRRGQASACKLTRARALLLSDQSASGPGWTDARIAEALGITMRAIEMLRRRGIENSVYRIRLA